MQMYAVQLGGSLGRNLAGDRIALVLDLSKKAIEKAAKRLIPVKLKGDRRMSRKEFTLIQGYDKSYRLVGNKTPHYMIFVRILKITNPKKFQR